MILHAKQWLVIELTMVGILVVLAWRKPTTLLLLVMATFAVGPEGVLRDHLPEPLLRWMVPIQHGFFVLALLANAVRNGVRLQPLAWPVLVVLLMVLSSLVLADRSDILGTEQVLLTALALALPWTITNVALEPRSRDRCALAFALLPLGSVAIGLVLRFADLMPVESTDAVTVFGLPAATHPGWLGVLAFAGFALAGHEALRSRDLGLAALASIDLAIAMASGGRVAAVACLAFIVIYVMLADQIQEKIGRRVAFAIAGTAGAMALVILLVPLALPFVPETAADEAVVVAALGGRERIWAAYLLDVLPSPIFGLGLGASGLVGHYADLPHNEYLRVLVETGVVGLVLYLAAIVFWGRNLLTQIRSADRPLALALFGTLALIATIDNLLMMPPTLVLFVYLDSILRSSRQRQRERGEVPASVAHSVSLAVQKSAASGRSNPIGAADLGSTFAPGDRRSEGVAPAKPGPGPAMLRRPGGAGSSDSGRLPSPTTNGGVGASITAGLSPASADAPRADANGDALPPTPTETAPAAGHSGRAPAAGIAPAAPTAIANAADPPEDLVERLRRQIELGQLAAARQTLEGAPEGVRRHTAVEAARAALDLAEKAHGLPPLETLLRRLKADEDDHAARIDLATALFARNQPDEAIDLLVHGVRKDREWRDQAARKQLLEFFTALGADHPATLEGRRKLAAVLFA